MENIIILQRHLQRTVRLFIMVSTSSTSSKYWLLSRNWGLRDHNWSYFWCWHLSFQHWVNI